jgi:hypothetical protein
MFGMDDRMLFMVVFGAIAALCVIIAIAHNRPDHRRRRGKHGGKDRRPWLDRLLTKVFWRWL